MKHVKTIQISLIVFISSIILLMVLMGNYVPDYITIGQAVKRALLCLMVLGINAILVTLLLVRRHSSEDNL